MNAEIETFPIAHLTPEECDRLEKLEGVVERGLKRSWRWAWP
jgi:hypothetical protein